MKNVSLNPTISVDPIERWASTTGNAGQIRGSTSRDAPGAGANGW